MTIKLNKKLRRQIRDCVMSGLATAFVGRLRRPLLTMSESTILGITIIAPNAALAFGPPPPPPGLWWCPSRPGPRWASSCAAGRAYRTTAAASDTAGPHGSQPRERDQRRRSTDVITY